MLNREGVRLKSQCLCFHKAWLTLHMDIVCSIDGDVVTQSPFIACHGYYCCISNSPKLCSGLGGSGIWTGYSMDGLSVYLLSWASAGKLYGLESSESSLIHLWHLVGWLEDCTVGLTPKCGLSAWLSFLTAWCTEGSWTPTRWLRAPSGSV